MSNCENTFTAWSQDVKAKIAIKNRVVEFLANIFWLLPQRLLLKQNVNRSTTDDGYIRHPYFFNHALDEYIRHKTHQMTCFQEK